MKKTTVVQRVSRQNTEIQQGTPKSQSDQPEIIECTALDNQTFSIVQDAGFSKFIEFLELPVAQLQVFLTFLSHRIVQCYLCIGREANFM